MDELHEIIKELRTSEGREFELVVSLALRFLGLRADLLEETQGEPDILVYARYAEDPYGLVVECSASKPHNQVSHEKVGQIRAAYARHTDKFKDASVV